jgi:5'-3' exonuclease
MDKLRDEYLPTIGFKNIFYQDGYEADDMIAMASKAMAPDLEEAIIITADQDLWQCIRRNVQWFDPKQKKRMNYAKFTQIFKMKPRDWAKVLAIAGCTTDNVEGIRNIGKITAIAYLTKHAGPKARKIIKQSWKSVVLRNRPLVQLPFKGTKTVRFKEDKIKQKGWNTVTKKLGMKSIRYKEII